MCSRRLFEDLEQGVERRLGEHVDFVDEVDLVRQRAAHRHVVGVFAQVANVVDAAVAGAVHLDQIERAASHRTALHDGHSLHGSPGLSSRSAAFFSQLMAFANRRAVVVLPVPRGPENRYACETLCDASALINVRVTTAWPGDVGEAAGVATYDRGLQPACGAQSFDTAWGADSIWRREARGESRRGLVEDRRRYGEMLDVRGWMLDSRLADAGAAIDQTWAAARC